MNLSKREIMLFGLTLFAVLIGVTYFIGAPQWDKWHILRESQTTLMGTLQSKRDMIASADEFREEAQSLEALLPAHGTADDVLGKLYPMLERLARLHDVQLNSRDAGDVAQYGPPVYELPITCRWEADVDPIISFLEALQSVETSLDVTSIYIQSVSKRQKERLKGTFTIRYVYKLEEAK